VRDEARADQLANQDRQVGGDRRHAALEVVVQLRPVLRQGHHLWGAQAFVSTLLPLAGTLAVRHSPEHLTASQAAYSPAKL